MNIREGQFVIVKLASSWRETPFYFETIRADKVMPKMVMMNTYRRNYRSYRKDCVVAAFDDATEAEQFAADLSRVVDASADKHRAVKCDYESKIKPFKDDRDAAMEKLETELANKVAEMVAGLEKMR